MFRLKLLSANLKERHKTLFGKSEVEVREYIYDVLFDNYLIDKGNKNIVENFNESVKFKENKRYDIKLSVKENLKYNLPDDYLSAMSRFEILQKRSRKIKKSWKNMKNI